MKHSLNGSDPAGAGKRQCTTTREDAFTAGVTTATLGAPARPHQSSIFVTQGKVVVISEVTSEANPVEAVAELATRLDKSHGCLLSSSYDYPGRYNQWTVGFASPPLMLESWDRRFKFTALSARGLPFLPNILQAVQSSPAVQSCEQSGDSITGQVRKPEGFFPEEQRSRQPSIFSVVRCVIELFSAKEDPHLGLYGAMGYDLAFQFEDVALQKDREPQQRDLVLYIPDELLVVNRQMQQAWRVRYDFVFNGGSGPLCTKGLDGKTPEVTFNPTTELPSHMPARELQPGAFAKMVDKAKEKFIRGDLFEAVLSQTFREPCAAPPSEIFRLLQQRNPSPYGFIMSLGEGEWLVGASPEMFVRVERNERGMRCETCPISGTIKRGKDALEDAENIRRILTDPKEESEITMCTDVDRNDKSRICEHGSVQVIGRRQIEMYSRLIHTVDHVEGYLRPEFDGIDAFLCHTWAVTVSGAPKTWAMRFIESIEPSQRRWYGAAVGLLAFDGHVNTGLTLRTIRIHGGAAEVRAGATLLYDSVPESEEQETELKASACLGVIRTLNELKKNDSEETAPKVRAPPSGASPLIKPRDAGCDRKKVLLIDFEDSFVHTLANYLRQTGAQVTTVRHSKAEEYLKSAKEVPDLAVLSPGPGCPKDFGASAHIQRLLDMKIGIFGVCLGLQSIVEHFGGKLGQLPIPMHGKPSEVVVKPKTSTGKTTVLASLPERFVVARYHSLYGLRPLPADLEEIATLAAPNEGTAVEPIVMGIQHKSLRMAAVQFHPESILTSPEFGMQMLVNALKDLS
mmetsp:Transcript_8589/g.15396  ORF Transcript_8589/g.15396 Transcript_8589/m.15396 type:complete len:798 (+) Transcript_8589:78-2471(+)